MTKYSMIRDAFGEYVSDDMYALVGDLMDRVSSYLDDDNDISDSILYAIDDGLIYYNDQWTIIKHYCNPEEASLSNSLDFLYDDLYELYEAGYLKA